MASLTSFFIFATLGFGFVASSSCVKKEFTETPIEVQDSCSPENIENRWRGELSYTRTETSIMVQWRKFVQDWTCVRNMKFFVDDVEVGDIWGEHREYVKINKIRKFLFKVEVYYRIPGTSGDCYGRKCKCFEATINLNVHEGNEGNGDSHQEDTFDEGTTALVAGAFAGGNLFFSVCLVKITSIIIIVKIIITTNITNIITNLNLHNQLYQVLSPFCS